jgi:hypothetical protein
MPDIFAMLVRLIRMMFRARWEVLEPRYQEAKYRNPTSDRCAEIVRSVIDDYGRMRQDAENQGITGLDKFYAVFSADLRDPIEACGDEWTVLIRLTQTPARCRVRPRAGIKVGVGRRLNPARDAEQRAEGVERVEPSVEAERELIEVGL